MKPTKDLEAAIKEKVSSLLDETMEKQLGITIPKIGSDITDQLQKPSLFIYIPLHLPFAAAKKKFKSEFMKRELRFHHGNVSQLAKHLGLDRRSIHRALKHLDIDRRLLGDTPVSHEEHQKTVIDQTIRSTLKQYKDILQPHTIELLYQEVPSLSNSIAKLLPHQELTWKEAEREFEKQFLSQALEEQTGNITATAAKLRFRPETLYRKMKKLQLRR